MYCDSTGLQNLFQWSSLFRQHLSWSVQVSSLVPYACRCVKMRLVTPTNAVTNALPYESDYCDKPICLTSAFLLQGCNAYHVRCQVIFKRYYLFVTLSFRAKSTELPYLHMQVLRCAVPCWLLNSYRHFDWPHYLHLQGQAVEEEWPA